MLLGVLGQSPQTSRRPALLSYLRGQTAEFVRQRGVYLGHAPLRHDCKLHIAPDSYRSTRSPIRLMRFPARSM